MASSTSSSWEPSQSLHCPICTECLPILPCHRHTCKCCHQTLCQCCFHSHILSVFDEGISGGGAGRSTLTCPFGCGHVLTDSEIRTCLCIANFNFWYHILGVLLFQLLKHMGCSPPSCWEDTTKTTISKYYLVFVQLTQTPTERLELRQYERWSLTIGLREKKKLPNHDEQHSNHSDDDDDQEEEEEEEVDVMYCPAPNCNYIWLASRKYRKQKLANERKYEISNSPHSSSSIYNSSTTSSLLRAASAYFFYRSPRPERDHDDWSWVDGEQLYDSFAATAAASNNHHWFTPQHGRHRGRNLQSNAAIQARRRSTTKKDEADGRRVVCAACGSTYCGLCRRPWIAYRAGDASGGGGGGGYGIYGKRESHAGKLCSAFRKKVARQEDGADEYAFLADAVDARSCPNCSIRTSRVDGCNHMTCPCGFEWCYVCECRWNFRHYPCADRVATEARRGEENNNFACVIS